MLKKTILAAALLAGTALSTLPAQANLVLLNGNVHDSFSDIGAQGFGNAPRMLTEQTKDFENGNATPINVANGDAISGANKTTTPTLSALHWGTGADVGIGFNSDQEGHTGITIQTLTLTVYNATAGGCVPGGAGATGCGAHALGSFSIAAPIDFSGTELDRQQGNGNAVFTFVLDAAQQVQFNTLTAMSGSGSFFAGLSSSLGCEAGAPASCLVSNDGPDTFIGIVAVPGPVVGAGLPSALAAFGMFGLNFWRRRRNGANLPT